MEYRPASRKDQGTQIHELTLNTEELQMPRFHGRHPSTRRRSPAGYSLRHTASNNRYPAPDHRPARHEDDIASGGAHILRITNMDFNITNQEWERIFSKNFAPLAKIRSIHFAESNDRRGSQNNSPETSRGVRNSQRCGTNVNRFCVAYVTVSSSDDAARIVSRYHHRKIGFKKIKIQVVQSTHHLAALKRKLLLLCQMRKGQNLEITFGQLRKQLVENCNTSIHANDIKNLGDIVRVISTDGFCTASSLISDNTKLMIITTGLSTTRIGFSRDNESQRCDICMPFRPFGDGMYLTPLQNQHGSKSVASLMVGPPLCTFSPKVHELLTKHNGRVPLSTFVSCYSTMFGNMALQFVEGSHRPPLTADGLLFGGQSMPMPLEHIIACVKNVHVRYTSMTGRKIVMLCHKPEVTLGMSSELCAVGDLRNQEDHTGMNRQIIPAKRRASDIERGRAGFSRRICRVLEDKAFMPLSSFLNAYHRCFKRQLRVADYGCPKLIELLRSIPETVEVLDGDRMGNEKMTLQPSVQLNRFAGLLRLSMCVQNINSLALSDIPFAVNMAWQMQSPNSDVRSLTPSDFGFISYDDLVYAIMDMGLFLVKDNRIELKFHHHSSSTLQTMVSKALPLIDRSCISLEFEIFHMLRTSRSMPCDIKQLSGALALVDEISYNGQITGDVFKDLDFAEIANITNDMGGGWPYAQSFLQTLVGNGISLCVVQNPKDFRCQVAISDLSDRIRAVALNICDLVQLHGGKVEVTRLRELHMRHYRTSLDPECLNFPDRVSMIRYMCPRWLEVVVDQQGNLCIQVSKLAKIIKCLILRELFEVLDNNETAYLSWLDVSSRIRRDLMGDDMENSPVVNVDPPFSVEVIMHQIKELEIAGLVILKNDYANSYIVPATLTRIAKFICTEMSQDATNEPLADEKLVSEIIANFGPTAPAQSGCYSWFGLFKRLEYAGVVQMSKVQTSWKPAYIIRTLMTMPLFGGDGRASVSSRKRTSAHAKLPEVTHRVPFFNLINFSPSSAIGRGTTSSSSLSITTTPTPPTVQATKSQLSNTTSLFKEANLMQAGVSHMLPQSQPMLSESMYHRSRDADENRTVPDWYFETERNLSQAITPPPGFQMLPSADQPLDPQSENYAFDLLQEKLSKIWNDSETADDTDSVSDNSVLSPFIYYRSYPFDKSTEV